MSKDPIIRHQIMQLLSQQFSQHRISYGLRFHNAGNPNLRHSVPIFM